MTRHAIVGGALWVGIALAFALTMVDLSVIELLFLLALLVTVPLGLELASRIGPNDQFAAPLKVARWVQPVAAIFAIASFWFSPGLRGAAFVLPWFLFACFLGLWGFARLVRGGFKNLGTFCSMAGLIYLPVGCAWLVASRVGLSPMGFQEPIVLLTAVHFHFAGFAAPIMAAATAAALQKEKILARTTFRAVAIGVVCGPGLLAAGFLTGPRLKLVAGLVVAGSEIGLALFFLGAMRALRPRLAQIFIALSFASVLFAMCFVAIWVIGDFRLKPLVDLAAMARFHGTANALGFTTCGLFGWTIAMRGGAREKGGTS